MNPTLPKLLDTKTVCQLFNITETDLTAKYIEFNKCPPQLVDSMKTIVLPGGIYRGIDAYTVTTLNPGYLKWSYDKFNYNEGSKLILKLWIDSIGHN